MYQVTASLQQAVSAASGRDSGSLSAAFDHVPGWVVRGALAAAWMLDNGTPGPGTPKRAEFLELFEGAVRFGPLLPRGSVIEPLSALRCKYPGVEECESFAVDRIVDGPDRCVCGGPLEPLKGRLRNRRVEVRTRVALDPDERALDGLLFSREAIPGATTLEGWIDGDHDWLDADSDRVVRFGGKRSTSGRATLALQKSSSPEAGPITQPGRLVVRLASPMISLDRLGRPVDRPDSVELAEILGIEASGLRLIHQYARPDRIGGWHAASGRPKPTELVMVAGSTYVYEATGLDKAGCDRLAATGLGHRRREGFGWIEVNPAPWAPPPHPETVARATSNTEPLAICGLRKLPAADRAWARSVVRDHQHRVELGRATNTQLFETARFKLLTEGQRAELRGLLDLESIADLHRAVVALNGGEQ